MPTWSMLVGASIRASPFRQSEYSCPSSGASQTSTIRVSAKVGGQGDALYRPPALVDISAGRDQIATNTLAPTMTSSRAQSQSWYFPWRKQKVSIHELGRLQG